MGTLLNRERNDGTLFTWNGRNFGYTKKLASRIGYVTTMSGGRLLARDAVRLVRYTPAKGRKPAVFHASVHPNEIEIPVTCAGFRELVPEVNELERRSVLVGGREKKGSDLLHRFGRDVVW